MKEIVISAADANQRLDKYLKRLFKEASGGFLYKMLRKKNITLNKQKADGHELLKEGDHVFVFFSDETFEKMQGISRTDAAFSVMEQGDHRHVAVVFENENLLIVNKPAGILTQKSKPSDHSINDEILHYLISTGALSKHRLQMFTPSVANRLDRNTSGLVLAGKTLAGQQFLSEVLRTRDARKTYHCVVLGEVSEEATKKAYLTKDPATNLVTIHATEYPGSKEIRTRFRPIKTNGSITLLEVDLLTGRTHQIRAHMAYLGHPVIGDVKYGDDAANARYRQEKGVRRQLLHSYRIQLPGGIDAIAEDPEIFSTIF